VAKQISPSSFILKACNVRWYAQAASIRFALAVNTEDLVLLPLRKMRLTVRKIIFVTAL